MHKSSTGGGGGGGGSGMSGNIDITMPPEDIQDDVLKALVQSNGTGCPFLKLILTSPEEYTIRPQLLDEFLTRAALFILTIVLCFFFLFLSNLFFLSVLTYILRILFSCCFFFLSFLFLLFFFFKNRYLSNYVGYDGQLEKKNLFFCGFFFFFWTILI